MSNKELVVVEMATVTIYDFIKENETPEEALERGVKYYKKNLHQVKSHLKNYGGNYWKEQVMENLKKVEAGCKVMAYSEYSQLKKKNLLSGEPKEIDAETFEEMLNVLPPVFYTTHNGVTMFCMSEMYHGTYTSQYAHDTRTGRYWTKLVDCADKSTWLCELLTV